MAPRNPTGASRQSRRMVDPDYAGQIRAGIGAKLNGQMTSSNSFKAFQTPMGSGISNAEKNRLIAQQRGNEFDNISSTRDKFNPNAAQGVVDFFGAGVNSSGKFEVNPAVLALNFFPFGKVLGPLGKAASLAARGEKIGQVLKPLIPAGQRLGNAARAVQARAAAQLRRANADELVARGLRTQGEDYVQMGYRNTGKVIRHEPGYVRNVQRGPFDEIISDNIESVGQATGDSWSEANRLVRMGFAKEVVDPKTGARTWISRDPSGLAESGAALLRESATASADAAARATRASTRIEQGVRYTRKTLEQRLKNYQRASRQPGFGVKTPKEPMAW